MDDGCGVTIKIPSRVWRLTEHLLSRQLVSLHKHPYSLESNLPTPLIQDRNDDPTEIDVEMDLVSIYRRPST